MESRLLAAAALAALVSLMLPPGPALAQTPGPPPAKVAAKISVQAGRRLGPVNPLVFGQNLEAGDTKGIFSNLTDTALIETGNGFWDPQARRPVPAVLGLMREAGVTALRYPGGSLANNFDWKRAVGPLASRGDWRFGLDEFLQVCRAGGAQPVITVSDYTGTLQDAADLVEYLNAPATSAHPWAKKRAAWGHPAPYGVRWFELGNESNNGNGGMTPHRQWTPDQYADYALATASVMRAVDPTIKIGIISAAGRPVDISWNHVVFARTGRIADFVVVHSYALGYMGDADPLPEPLLMQACLAAGDQWARTLGDYHAALRRDAGRDLPLAVTEYNASFVQDRPHPYRFSYGAGLFSADFVRTLLQPDSGVVLANYWQFLNGYWGMVQGGGSAYRPQAAFPLFRLWGRHFGSTLVASAVQTPGIDFPGFSPEQQAHFQGIGPPPTEQGGAFLPQRTLNSANLADPAALSFPAAPGYAGEAGPDGTLTFRFSGASGALYPTLATIPRPAGAAPAGYGYHLSFEARFLPDAGSGPGPLGLGLTDTRGWDATHSGLAVEGIEGARDWTPFTGAMSALPDATGVSLLVRAEPGGTPISGRMEVRRLRLDAVTIPVYPAYAALTATASLSPDGRTLYLIVFNRSSDGDIAAPVSLSGFRPASARRWTVTGPSLAADNQSQPLARETETAVPTPTTGAGLASHVFPARSMTAFEFRRAGK